MDFEIFARVSAVNKWYVKDGNAGNRASLVLATSDPNGTNVSYLEAAIYCSYIAPRDCKLIRAHVRTLNYTNNDDTIVTIFKGTAVDNSTSNIQIDRIGNAMTIATTANKTFFESQDFSSGNSLSANDFIIFTHHVTSYSSTHYPMSLITLEFEYT